MSWKPGSGNGATGRWTKSHGLAGGFSTIHFGGWEWDFMNHQQ